MEKNGKKMEKKMEKMMAKKNKLKIWENAMN